jgi:reductive dehalogenase
MGDKWYRSRYEFKDSSEATSQLKRTARFYGASLVGMTELNNHWLYANKRFDLETLELHESAKYAVVMAIEMDEEAISKSPSCPAAAATGICYSKMAFVASSMAEFIRNLGYIAIPAGNDTALSIPLAIDAGLGQLGRNGLLITPEYGPRVRLCKVFTDLPLVPDKPIDFGVTNFCKGCAKCADACEVDAISKDPEPRWEPACKSNNTGALKWYVDSEKCYEFWCENGTDCSTCISVCPYNIGSNVVEGLRVPKR